MKTMDSAPPKGYIQMYWFDFVYIFGCTYNLHLWVCIVLWLHLRPSNLDLYYVLAAHWFFILESELFHICIQNLVNCRFTLLHCTIQSLVIWVCILSWLHKQFLPLGLYYLMDTFNASWFGLASIDSRLYIESTPLGLHWLWAPHTLY
jgi:hypothetical protein